MRILDLTCIASFDLNHLSNFFNIITHLHSSHSIISFSSEACNFPSYVSSPPRYSHYSFLGSGPEGDDVL